MEAKKNPSKDIHRKRSVFFLIGICCSLSLVITAFQWTTLKAPQPVKRSAAESDVVFSSVPVTVYPEPQPPKNTSVEKKSATSYTIVSTDDPSMNDEPSDLTPTFAPDSAVFVLTEPEPEDSVAICVFPERWPEPADGYEKFYRLIAKNLKYPKQASRAGIEGKVFVQFTVRGNGDVIDLKIVKGIGFGCDEEALRVLALPKWEPGKQRGKPVNVKMVLPLVFKML